MVDSALVCDLLHSVRFCLADLHFIVSDDDDFVPAAFTAEAWGGKVFLLRRRENGSRHLKTQGLIFGLEPQ